MDFDTSPIITFVSGLINIKKKDESCEEDTSNFTDEFSYAVPRVRLVSVLTFIVLLLSVYSKN